MTKQGTKTVQIYTDGACSGNPGPGGWAAILLYGNKIKEVSGYEANTTNQRMEIKALLEGLAALKVTGWNVIAHSDSAYVVNAFQNGWLKKWEVNGWVTSGKKPVANQDLWKPLWELSQINQLSVIKVPGHKGVEWNERCDLLARQEIKKGLNE
ncbi:MAG: ribonuclease HI [Chitinophagales bacterium]